MATPNSPVQRRHHNRVAPAEVEEPVCTVTSPPTSTLHMHDHDVESADRAIHTSSALFRGGLIDDLSTTVRVTCDESPRGDSLKGGYVRVVLREFDLRALYSRDLDQRFEGVFKAKVSTAEKNFLYQANVPDHLRAGCASWILSAACGGNCLTILLLSII